MIDSILQEAEDATKNAYTSQDKKRKIEEKIKSIINEKESLEMIRREITENNTGLIIKIAKSEINRAKQSGVYPTIELKDLIQEGSIGFMAAVENYDPQKGSITTYSVYWITQKIRRYLDGGAKTIRVPVKIEEMYRRISEASNRLYMVLEREPTIQEIAQELGEPEEDIKYVIEKIKTSNPLYIEEIIENTHKDVGGGILFKEMIPQKTPEDIALKNISKNELIQTIESISMIREGEKEALFLRFGLRDMHSRTLKEVGEKMGISRERARQLIENCIEKLRRYYGNQTNT